MEQCPFFWSFSLRRHLGAEGADGRCRAAAELSPERRLRQRGRGRTQAVVFLAAAFLAAPTVAGAPLRTRRGALLEALGDDAHIRRDVGPRRFDECQLVLQLANSRIYKKK